MVGATLSRVIGGLTKENFNKTKGLLDVMTEITARWMYVPH